MKQSYRIPGTGFRLTALSLAFASALLLSAAGVRADAIGDLYERFEAGDVEGAKEGMLALASGGAEQDDRVWLLSAAIALREERLALAVVSLQNVREDELPESLRPLFDETASALEQRLQDPQTLAAVAPLVRRAFAEDFGRATRLGQIGEATRILAEQFVEGHFGASEVGQLDNAALLVPSRSDDVRLAGLLSLRHRLWSDHDETFELGFAVTDQVYFDQSALDYLGVTLSGRYSRLLDGGKVLHIAPFIGRSWAGTKYDGLLWRGGAVATLETDMAPGRRLAVSAGLEGLSYDTVDDLDGWRARLGTVWTAYDIAPDMRLVLEGGIAYQDAREAAFDRLSLAAGPALTWFGVGGVADVTARVSLGTAWHFDEDTIETTRTRRDYSYGAGLEAEFPLPGDHLSVVLRGQYFRQISNIARQDYDNGTVGIGLRARF